MSCWNLCCTDSTYAVEIGKDFTAFIYYQKNCTTAAIDYNSYPVWFHGERADGGKFLASVIKFVEMLVVALDHAYHKEGDIYKQVRHLITLGKQKPGSDIQFSTVNTTGKDCFLIPLMSYINSRKDNYNNLTHPQFKTYPLTQDQSIPSTIATIQATHTDISYIHTSRCR